MQDILQSITNNMELISNTLGNLNSAVNGLTQTDAVLDGKIRELQAQVYSLSQNIKEDTTRLTEENIALRARVLRLENRLNEEA